MAVAGPPAGGGAPPQPGRRRFLGEVLARLTLLDRLLVVLAGGLVGLSFRVWRPSAQRGARVVAEQDGHVIFTAPLDEPRQVRLQGPLGVTVLVIAKGEARILSSPCPDKICVRSGAIHAVGELLACVPNRIVVRIEGPPREAEYDLISR